MTQHQQAERELSLHDPAIPFTIALLEDDAMLARMISATLERSGYRVHTFSTITAARAALLRIEWDLLICDRRLPDGDGIELCAELKADRDALTRYVIVMTGEDSEAAKVEGFDRGADDYIIKPASIPELLARVRAGLRIVELQKALVLSNKRLERLSRTDALTGALNRRAFNAELSTAFEHAVRYERPLALLLLDLDHFKSVNDEFGHPTGDAVLATAAEIIRENTRVSDIAARFGGEEFAVILPETHLVQAVQVAEKIRRSLETAAITIGDHALRVSASIGAASMPHSRFPDTRALINAADSALYRAKRRGRNIVEMERRSDPTRITQSSNDERLAAIV